LRSASPGKLRRDTPRSRASSAVVTSVGNMISD
jgi:hypothetical protein